MSSFHPQSTVGQSKVQLSARRPVRWARLKVIRRVEPHDHEFTEIVLITAGKAEHLILHGQRKLGAGDILIIPPGQVHAFGSVRNLELVNIYFLPEWFLPELALDETGHGILPLFFSASLFRRSEAHVIHEFRVHPRLIEKVIRELEEMEVGIRLEWATRWITCCFFKALLILAEAYRSALGTASSARLVPKIWSAFVEIDRCARTGEKLALVHLARNLGCTRDHLTRFFRAGTGQTPNEFYQARRLQFVCRALLETKVTVAEISQQFGFADEAHLCRLFRKCLLLTPSDYRSKFNYTSQKKSVATAVAKRRT